MVRMAAKRAAVESPVTRESAESLADKSINSRAVDTVEKAQAAVDKLITSLEKAAQKVGSSQLSVTVKSDPEAARKLVAFVEFRRDFQNRIKDLTSDLKVIGHHFSNLDTSDVTTSDHCARKLKSLAKLERFFDRYNEVIEGLRSDNSTLFKKARELGVSESKCRSFLSTAAPLLRNAEKLFTSLKAGSGMAQDRLTALEQNLKESERYLAGVVDEFMPSGGRRAEPATSVKTEVEPVGTNTESAPGEPPVEVAEVAPRTDESPTTSEPANTDSVIVPTVQEEEQKVESGDEQGAEVTEPATTAATQQDTAELPVNVSIEPASGQRALEACELSLSAVHALMKRWGDIENQTDREDIRKLAAAISEKAAELGRIVAFAYDRQEMSTLHGVSDWRSELSIANKNLDDAIPGMVDDDVEFPAEVIAAFEASDDIRNKTRDLLNYLDDFVIQSAHERSAKEYEESLETGSATASEDPDQKAAPAKETAPARETERTQKVSTAEVSQHADLESLRAEIPGLIKKAEELVRTAHEFECPDSLGDNRAKEFQSALEDIKSFLTGQLIELARIERELVLPEFETVEECRDKTTSIGSMLHSQQKWDKRKFYGAMSTIDHIGADLPAETKDKVWAFQKAAINALDISNDAFAKTTRAAKVLQDQVNSRRTELVKVEAEKEKRSGNDKHLIDSFRRFPAQSHVKIVREELKVLRKEEVEAAAELTALRTSENQRREQLGKWWNSLRFIEKWRLGRVKEANDTKERLLTGMKLRREKLESRLDGYVRNAFAERKFRVEKGNPEKIPQMIINASIPETKRNTLISFDELASRLARYMEKNDPKMHYVSDLRAGRIEIIVEGQTLRYERQRDGRVIVYGDMGDGAGSIKRGGAWTDDALRGAIKFVENRNLKFRKTSHRDRIIPPPDFLNRSEASEPAKD